MSSKSRQRESQQAKRVSSCHLGSSKPKADLQTVPARPGKQPSNETVANPAERVGYGCIERRRNQPLVGTLRTSAARAKVIIPHILPVRAKTACFPRSHAPDENDRRRDPDPSC